MTNHLRGTFYKSLLLENIIDLKNEGSWGFFLTLLVSLILPATPP